MNHKPTHIALFGLKGFPAIGGTAAAGENLVKELNDRYRFTVYGTSSHGRNRQPYNNVRMFIVFKFLPHKLNVFYYNLVSAMHALLFGNYDIVHTNQIDTGFIVPLLRLRYRVIATHHGKTYNMSKWGYAMQMFFRVTERLMVAYAHRVTFVAESERLDAEKKFGGRYLTIRNGIDPTMKISDVEAPVDYIMFAAGRIVPHKECHTFLEALKRIAYKGKILIAGDHKQIDEYGIFLESYRQSLDVVFLGMITCKAELLGYVRKANLFVFPSSYEAMSMMLLEVALVKTPLLCSDIIENKNVFTETEVEYFKAGNADDLAQKIQLFRTRSQDFKDKADRAFKKVISEYSSAVIARHYSELYSVFERHMGKIRVLEIPEVELDAVETMK